MVRRLGMSRLDSLWGEGTLRAFISHKAEDKVRATGLKECLRYNGIASFVAHEDIEPTQLWQTQIEIALLSMHVLIALLTEGFSNSNWTDQEVGVAVGREVLVIPVSLGKDPYGFIGKYQAIRGFSKNNQEIADEIYDVIQRSNTVPDDLKLLAESARASAEASYIDSYISVVARSGSFSRSNELAKQLPRFTTMSSRQEEAFVQAFNRNNQACGAFGFSDISKHLERLTGNSYVLDNYQLVKLPF